MCCRIVDQAESEGIDFFLNRTRRLVCMALGEWNKLKGRNGEPASVRRDFACSSKLKVLLS
jgi:hypothetical protein